MHTPRLADLPVTAFLERLAATTPTPGGGSVAALAGALAASLGRMVCGYTLGKPRFAAVAPQVQALADRFVRAARALTALLDEDAAAYEVLSAALKLDQANPERPARVAAAARLAASVPLETAALSRAVRGAAEELVRLGNPLLRSDAEAAAHLADAALAAAAANVRANLPLLEASDAAEFTAQLDGLTSRAGPPAPP